MKNEIGNLHKTYYCGALAHQCLLWKCNNAFFFIVDLHVVVKQYKVVQ